MKLLIVEDNAEMRRLITGLVRDIAETINECSDGSQALAAYIEDQPDWVVMDIRMDLLDGITATRKLIETFPEAQIVIISDFDDAKLRAAASAAGACAYVMKEDLFVLRRILGNGPR